VCRTDWFEVSDFDSEDESPKTPPTLAPDLPPPTITFDPQTSIKTITTYHISSLSTNRIRTIRKIHLPPPQASAERIALHLKWPKFGILPPPSKRQSKAPGTDDGEVTRWGEDIPFYLGTDWREKEKEWTDEREKERIVGGIVCRNCAGSHFTAQCPLPAQKDQAKPKEPTISPIATPGKYVPPARRSGPSSSSSADPGEPEHETTSLRVSSIATTVTETELADRFARFGRVVRAFCVRDYQTGEYRGIGYVTFAKREDAERALSGMDRRGFDNLIMRVEWDSKDRGKKWKL
jgi:translation initiation factor 3 subunit G